MFSEDNPLRSRLWKSGELLCVNLAEQCGGLRHSLQDCPQEIPEGSIYHETKPEYTLAGTSLDFFHRAARAESMIKTFALRRDGVLRLGIVVDSTFGSHLDTSGASPCIVRLAEHGL